LSVLTTIYLFIYLCSVKKFISRPVALMLQCCVCLSSVRNVLRPRAKVTIDSRIWKIDWYQNEWPWTWFRGRLKPRQLLLHIRNWISRKPLEKRVGSIGPPIGNDLSVSNGHVTNDVAW